MASDRRKEFLFLNQSFSAGPRSQREKELQDADRRAHAARNSTYRHQIPRVDSAHSSATRRLKKPHRHPADEAEHHGSAPADLSRKRHLVLRSRLLKVEEGSSAQSHDEKSLTTTLSLGQGNHDPFDTASVARLPPFIDGVMDYCFRFVWPTLGCADPQSEAKYAITRRQGIREHPFMLHAYITNATAHQLRLYPPHHPARTLLGQARTYHERKAFEAVSIALQSQSEAVPDGLLVALFIVVFTAGDYEEQVTKYPASPLAKAQSLHLYTNMEVTPGKIQHIQQISRLLDTRGGLDGVSQHDWVNAAILADIFVASRLGVRPLWPLPLIMQHHFQAFNDLVLDPQAYQLSLVMGRGFSCVKNLDLLRILTLACRTTLALDLHRRGVSTAPKIWELGKVRNAIQHALCCLDPPSKLLLSHDDLLYDLVRLAALMYSDFVLFPLGDAVRPRLAYDLRQALELLLAGNDLGNRAERELIIWCIMMGTVTSCGTVHQEWYVERFSHLLREDRRLLDWILFQTLMSHYLWWDYILQPRCLDVWSEAVQLLQRDRSRSMTSETVDTPGSGLPCS